MKHSLVPAHKQASLSHPAKLKRENESQIGVLLLLIWSDVYVGVRQDIEEEPVPIGSQHSAADGDMHPEPMVAYLEFRDLLENMQTPN